MSGEIVINSQTEPTLPDNYDEEIAAVESAGYKVEQISPISEGEMHRNFRVVTNKGVRIARFISPTSSSEDIFGLQLSLQREAALINIVRQDAKLPAPVVDGIYSHSGNEFLIESELPGIHWSEFLRANNHSLESFLNSLKYLGQDLARVHSISFTSFGDVMAGNVINPGTTVNFSDRVKIINNLLVQRAKVEETMEERELEQVVQYFKVQTELADKHLDITNLESVFTFADIHPRQFLVDGKGQPSGYLDLESCQAAPKALDLYNIRLQLFNYYDAPSATLAEKEFLQGYRVAGGNYEPEDPINKSLERLLTMVYIFATAIRYKRFETEPENVRCNWSRRYKNLLFEVMEGGEIDYPEITAILRQKTLQPLYPRVDS